MGLLSFLFSDDSDSTEETELNYEQLFTLADQWINEAAENEGDAANAYRREAVEYIAHETGGDFWRWLRGE